MRYRSLTVFGWPISVGGHSYTQDNRDQKSVIVHANIWCRTKGEPAGGAQKRLESYSTASPGMMHLKQYIELSDDTITTAD